MIIADVLVVDGEEIRKPINANEIYSKNVKLLYLYQKPNCAWTYLIADENGWTQTDSLTNHIVGKIENLGGKVCAFTNIQRAFQAQKNKS